MSDVEIYADDLKPVLESLEEATDAINGFGHLVSAEVDIEIESAVTVKAEYDGGRWAVKLTARD